MGGAGKRPILVEKRRGCFSTMEERRFSTEEKRGPIVMAKSLKKKRLLP